LTVCFSLEGWACLFVSLLPTRARRRFLIELSSPANRQVARFTTETPKHRASRPRKLCSVAIEFSASVAARWRDGLRRRDAFLWRAQLSNGEFRGHMSRRRLTEIIPRGHRRYIDFSSGVVNRPIRFRRQKLSTHVPNEGLMQFISPVEPLYHSRDKGPARLSRTAEGTFNGLWRVVTGLDRRFSGRLSLWPCLFVAPFIILTHKKTFSGHLLGFSRSPG